MADLVCIVYYRDADVEIRSRADWLRAPLRDVQLVACNWPATGRYYTTRQHDPRDPWHWEEGEYFWVWRAGEPHPFPCDWIELADYMHETGVLAKDAPLLSLSLADIEAAGVKYGLNLNTDLYQEVYQRAKADERLPAWGRRV